MTVTHQMAQRTKWFAAPAGPAVLAPMPGNRLIATGATATRSTRPLGRSST